MALDDLVPSKRVDVGLRESELTQDLLGVLADVRRRRPDRAGRPRQRDGRALDAHLSELAVLDRRGRPRVLHLLVLECLLDVEDGAVGHALGVEQLYTLRARLG